MPRYALQSPVVGMGAVLTNANTCGFRVWAPNAADVRVIGDFNGWSFDTDAEATIYLFHDGGGYWSAEVSGVRPGERYEFVIRNHGRGPHDDGNTHFRHDPYALDTCHDTGKSIVVDVRAELAEAGLENDPFGTPRPSDLICYQMHVGSFCGRGDGVDVGPDGAATFAQVADRLAYVREMGFNAVCLLPDIENQGDLSQGYGPVHLFAPESAYGKPADLRRFVRRAHDIGLAVIADVVYNHFTFDGNKLWNFDGNTFHGGIYFTEPETRWGPRPAHWRREVRDFFLDHLRMLFRDYRFDGVRFDAAHEVSDECRRHLVAGVRSDPFWKGKLLISEWTGSQDDWRYAVGGLGMTAVWSLGDRDAALDAVDDTNVPPWRRVNRAIDLLQDHAMPGEAPLVRFPLGSHDNVKDDKDGKLLDDRHRYFAELLGGRSNWHARAKCRIAWALASALPGIPMLFMGSEFCSSGYWMPSSDRWGDHRLDWTIAGDGWGLEMRRLVAAANAMRFANPCLRGRNVQLVHRDPDNAVIAFKRWTDQGTVFLVVANLGEGEWAADGYGVSLSDSGGVWQEVFNSQASEYGGTGLGNGGASRSSDGDQLRITLPKWSVLVFHSV